MTRGQFARVPVRAANLRHLSARDLRVLIAIAAHLNSEGFAYPGITRIAALAAVDRSKVPSSIKKLVAAGLVRARRRRDESGDFASTVYEILFKNPEVLPLVGTPVPPGGNTDVPRSGNAVLPLVATPGVPTGGNLTDHSFNRPSNRHTTHRRVEQYAVNAVPDAQFEEFWQKYPSRGGHNNPKKPAREKFLAAIERGVDPKLIITAAANYASFITRSGTDGKYVKQAQFWLSHESWEQYGAPDEPEPLRAGMI
jgi:hypothetical protein